MACPEFEDLILDYCEGAASPADRALLESHVAACGDCRALLAMQQELDLCLSRSIARPVLSTAFAPRLAARMAEQRRAPQFRWLPRILDGIGYLSLASAAGCLIQQLPHPGIWIGLTALAGSAAFGLWETGKALRDSFGHR
ncbi:MAG TPA: zf-HC2 domain-containing protein [Bryobacteraceae bacterium]|jgi:anti-sigma factor RsiW|nr:zf-HC2 domain-containing protein [Bryobacteraceae bacterium]